MREKTRVDAIYETLRDRICLGMYTRGDVFHEADLGQEFNVSRTPIRQVLQRLAFEKLTVVRTGVGTIVEGCSDSVVRDYLEIHARLLSSVSELGLVAEPSDQEDAVAMLHFRASRLKTKSDPMQFWLVLKGLQEVSNQLIGDDLIRHMDELLFYRTGPAVMQGVRAAPRKAAEVLKRNVGDVIDPIEEQNDLAFFALQSANVRRYAKLLREA